MGRTYTKDEKSIIVGFLMSAGIAGIGIYQLYSANTTMSIFQYIAFMVTGAMMFNAGVAGVCALGAIYYNYQATL